MSFRKVLTVSLIGCGVLSVVAAVAFWLYREVQYRDDVINNEGNLGRVYTRLEEFRDKHGSYPEQQDMTSLLNTLEMDESELYHVRMFDIKSAEYRAPVQDSDVPVLTMRIKRHVFGREGLFVIQKNVEGFRDITFDNQRFNPEDIFQ